MGATQQLLVSYGSNFVGPLDAYASGGVEFYSIYQRLRSSFTGSLLRVRRSSDDAELDIGYGSDNKLDTAALLAFCGASEGWVVQVMGQLNGLHLIQPSPGLQRRIVTGGVVDAFADGTPCMRATSADTQGYYTDLFTSYTGNAASIFAVGSITAGTASSAAIGALVSDAGYASWGNALGMGQQDTNQRISSYQNGGATGIDFVFGSKHSWCVDLDGTNTHCRQGATQNTGAYTSGLSNVQRILAAGCYQVSTHQSGSSDGWQGMAVYFNTKAADQLAIMAALEGAV